jgi:multidrug efflux pump subunit AcrA (membrane-fusion protein)
MNYHGLIIGMIIGLLAACGNKHEPAAEPAKEEANDSVDARTPVTVTEIGHGAVNDSIQLNAVSAFLQKSYVKANANGYLQSSDVYPGKYVEVGQPLFSLKTKEAQIIGDYVRGLDSSLKFTGVNQIKANQHGYITQLNHQSGDYVQDGEQLAVISDRNSFVFMLDLPYELRGYVLNKETVSLELPDGERLVGHITEVMPTVDSASQTQDVVIRVSPPHAIPENLVARVHIEKLSHAGAQSLPKAAVLTNDTEDEFWVMKLIDSATAVKVPVKKGIETKDRVEILSPVFSPSDRILVSGNYGLPDTAKVKVSE